jgi:hypothetical protein
MVMREENALSECRLDPGSFHAFSEPHGHGGHASTFRETPAHAV